MWEIDWAWSRDVIVTLSWRKWRHLDEFDYFYMSNFLLQLRLETLYTYQTQFGKLIGRCHVMSLWRHHDVINGMEFEVLNWQGGILVTETRLYRCKNLFSFLYFFAIKEKQYVFNHTIQQSCVLFKVKTSLSTCNSSLIDETLIIN